MTNQLYSVITMTRFFCVFLSDYLCNVLDDLGLQPTDILTHLTDLLKASPEDYSDVIEDKPQRLISAIANMRNIPIH